MALAGTPLPDGDGVSLRTETAKWVFLRHTPAVEAMPWALSVDKAPRRRREPAEGCSTETGLADTGAPQAEVPRGEAVLEAPRSKSQ